VLKIPGGTYSSPLFFFYHGPRPPHYRRFMILLKNTTVGRTPQDERSARRRDFYLTTQNTHNRQASMPPAGFELTFPATVRPQTHALDRTATVIGTIIIKTVNEWSGQMLNKLLPSGIRRWWFGRQLPTFRRKTFQLHLQNIATLKSVAADSSVKPVGVYQTTRSLVREHVCFLRLRRDDLKSVGSVSIRNDPVL
jgi:hypothetical protein